MNLYMAIKNIKENLQIYNKVVKKRSLTSLFCCAVKSPNLALFRIKRYGSINIIINFFRVK